MSAGAQGVAAVDTQAAYEALSGPQRAALFMLLLGETHGRALWAMLDEEEVRILSRAMVELGPVDADLVERLLVEFARRLAGGGVAGSLERTEELLHKIFPPQEVAVIMAEIYRTTGSRIWSRLGQIDPSIFATWLRSQYPQTIAVILSRLRPEECARILTQLPEEVAVETIDRMLRTEKVQREALEAIEENLRQEFVGAVSRSARRDPHESMAEIFNAFDSRTEARFLSWLEERDRPAARRIREAMFTFEDLLRLDAGAIQTLIRKADRTLIARSLKGAGEPVRALFLSNMSSRAGKNLVEEIDALGPLRAREVEAARADLVLLARKLADAGEILIGRANAQDELVY